MAEARKYKEQKSRETVAEVKITEKTTTRIDKIVEIDDAVKIDIRDGFYRNGEYVHTTKGYRFNGMHIVEIAKGLLGCMTPEQLDEIKSHIGNR